MAETAVRIDRKLSIENEPKTLRFHQIECAREAALYVMSTRSIEEAMRIFTEGLEPVASVAKSGNSYAMTEMEEVDGLNELQQIHGVKDIESAPF
ncbi:hypothetical protein SLA2020_001720 [Shorea laevis]